jgi:hypothetical protein
MRRHLLAAACLLAYCHAEAGTIGIDTVSAHVPQRGQDDFNPGAYYRFDNGASFGAYHNSMRRVSAWAGWSWSFGPVSLTAGAITGYQIKHEPVPCADHAPHAACVYTLGDSPGAVAPLVAPSVVFPSLLGVTPRVVVMPGFGRASTAIHLTLEIPL